jgi:hypothetical protein
MLDTDAASLQDLLGRVSRLLASFSSEITERPIYYLEILALFDRARGLVAAIGTLVAYGFSNEALVLARPLLTDSLALAELAAADERRRAELVLGWELHSLAELNGVALEAEARGEDWTAQIEALEDWTEKVRGYARRHALSTRHWQPDERAKELAAKHDRADEYLDLRFLHHFVHGSTFATKQRYTSDDEVTAVGGPAIVHEVWIAASVLSAAQSGLFAARYFCTIFGLNEPTELGDLLEEVADRIAATREEE